MLGVIQWTLHKNYVSLANYSKALTVAIAYDLLCLLLSGRVNPT